LYLHAIGRYNFITKQNRENFEKWNRFNYRGN
jgi:hypothetical protein